jgi:hypothetical protein
VKVRLQIKRLCSWRSPLLTQYARYWLFIVSVNVRTDPPALLLLHHTLLAILCNAESVTPGICGNYSDITIMREVKTSVCRRNDTNSIVFRLSIQYNQQLKKEKLTRNRPKNKLKQTPWPESASELHRPSDRPLSAKLVPIFAERGCHMVSVTGTYAVFSAY